jgi:hypothetical protein
MFTSQTSKDKRIAFTISTKMSSPRPNFNQSDHPDHSNLIPQDRSDFDTLDRLISLGPSVWAPLTPPQASGGGLLCWLADINWPIALPISKLLVSLANDARTREQYGHYLVDSVNELFMTSDDWDWVYWVLVHVVCKIEDEAWRRREFGEGLRALRERVPLQEEKDWGFEKEVTECLGETKLSEQERSQEVEVKDSDIEK